MAKLNLGGGLSGAASGAALGSYTGPWGAPIGGLIGGALGLFSGGQKKSKPDASRVPGKDKNLLQASRLSPMQEELMKLVQEGLTKGTGPYAELFAQKPYNSEGFDAGIAKPALRMFQDETLPMLQERFISGNQVLGSGLRDSQLKEARKFQENLEGLRYQDRLSQQQMGSQNRNNALNLLLGTPSVENIYKQPGKSTGQNFLESAGGPLFEFASKAGLNLLDSFLGKGSQSGGQAASPATQTQVG